jgi:hypothetical protein
MSKNYANLNKIKIIVNCKLIVYFKIVSVYMYVTYVFLLAGISVIFFFPQNCLGC